MFKDFAAGVDIQLSGKRLQVLMAYTHPGVPSSLGPELAAGAQPPFNKENLQKVLASGPLSVPQLPAPRPSLTAAILPLPLLLTPPSLHIWVWRHSAEVVTHPGGMFTLCLCEPFAWGHCQCLSPPGHCPLAPPPSKAAHPSQGCTFSVAQVQEDVSLGSFLF